MPELTVYFSRRSRLELERSYFRNLPFEVHGVRGGHGGASLRTYPISLITIPWSITTAALSVLLLRSAASGVGTLSPFERSLVFALEHVLTKPDHWLYSVLGVDSDGRPLAPLLLRQTTQAGYASPHATLSFDSNILSSLAIYHDGEAVSDPDVLLHLAQEIVDGAESVRRPSVQPAAGFRYPKAKTVGTVASGRVIRRP